MGGCRDGEGAGAVSRGGGRCGGEACACACSSSVRVLMPLFRVMAVMTIRLMMLMTTVTVATSEVTPSVVSSESRSSPTVEPWRAAVSCRRLARCFATPAAHSLSMSTIMRVQSTRPTMTRYACRVRCACVRSWILRRRGGRPGDV
jgi:hypothetical protein